MEIVNVELVRIDGNEGDDQISTQTPTRGALNGGLGGDTVFVLNCLAWLGTVVALLFF